MFSNFTKETCTGTGDTLELAGATTGMIPFSKSYADGDLVAYVLEDSGGVIKVAGVGTYVTATDDITRNDTWNWNGTAIDNNPSTNITLSGGAHTISCDVVDKKILATRNRMVNVRADSQYITDAFTVGSSPVNRNGVINRLWLTPFVTTGFVELSGMGIDIKTLATTGTIMEFGVYIQKPEDESFILLGKTSSIDTSPTGVTGYNIASFIVDNLELFPHSVYFFAASSDSDAVMDGINHASSGHPYMPQRYDDKGVAMYYAVTGIPSSLAAPVEGNTQSNGVYPNIFGVIA